MDADTEARTFRELEHAQDREIPVRRDYRSERERQLAAILRNILTRLDRFEDVILSPHSETHTRIVEALNNKR